MSDVAITQLVAAFVTLLGFIGTILKMRNDRIQAEKKFNEAKNELGVKLEEAKGAVSDKIDVNTKVTKAGIKVASENAQVAVTAATDAKEVTQAMVATVSRKLNGELTTVVEEAIAKQMAPVIKRLDEVESNQRRSDHNLANHLQAQGNTLESILEVLTARSK